MDDGGDDGRHLHFEYFGFHETDLTFSEQMSPPRQLVPMIFSDS